MNHSQRAAATAVGAVAAVAAVLGLVLTAVVLPAHAGTQSKDDAAGDVRLVQTPDSPGATPSSKPRRKDRAHDVVWSRADYGDGKLRLTTEVRELADDGYIAVWVVKTKTARWWVRYDKSTAPAEVALSIAGGGDSPCDLGSSASDRTDRVRVTVPRTCLGNKRWIRYGAIVGIERPAGLLFDDGRRKGDFLVNDAFLGPKVRYN